MPADCSSPGSSSGLEGARGHRAEAVHRQSRCWLLLADDALGYTRVQANAEQRTPPCCLRSAPESRSPARWARSDTWAMSTARKVSGSASSGTILPVESTTGSRTGSAILIVCPSSSALARPTLLPPVQIAQQRLLHPPYCAWARLWQTVSPRAHRKVRRLDSARLRRRVSRPRLLQRRHPGRGRQSRQDPGQVCKPREFTGCQP
jgi:hypothetical protein